MLLLAAFNFIGIVRTLLMIVFILSALLLMLVVLLQEPKGGGLSSAFGGAGAETFGVQTGSVNRFTAWVAGIFMMSALLFAAFRPDGGSSMFDNPTTQNAPSNGGGAPAGNGPGAPAGNGAGAPAGNGAGAPAGNGDKPADDGGAPAGDGSGK